MSFWVRIIIYLDEYFFLIVVLREIWEKEWLVFFTELVLKFLFNNLL